MGISKKGKKQKNSDKETQSPLLKVFKEMIQREKSDPEKTILIKKEKQENRKKKNYSGLNQKCDDISGNSSSTERFKSTRDSKMAQDLQQQIYNHQNQDMAHSMPYSSEKKESWWFWKDSKKKKKQPDDTCSCVSCAFKKIISSDYVCIGCLVLVFALSLGVAFFVVYNSMSPICLKPEANMVQNPKNAKHQQKARRQFRSDGETDDGLANQGRKNWKDFKDFVTNPWRSLPLAPGTDFGDTNLRDANYVEESGSGISGALSRVLDADKLSDGQNSEKLRDFYKRLIQTDACIKKLKTKTDASNTYNTIDGVNSMSVPERYKRSLKSVSSPVYFDSKKKETEDDPNVDLTKFKLFYPPFVAVRNENSHRLKRNDENIFNIEPSGIIIEKKKVMVQYAPFERKRNFPKCSHSPNLYKSHEKQLKHPFYRNSQRLDELLGQLLDKNIDKVVANPLNLDVLLGDRDTCKHSKQEPEIATPIDYDLRKQDTISPTKPSIEDMIDFSSVKNTDVNLDADADDILKLTDVKTEDLDSDSKSSLVERKEIQRHRDDTGESDRYLFRSTTPRYDLLLSISTLINSNPSDIVKISKEKPESVLKKRKLQQLNEEDDESLGYEDFKEVLSDYTDSHDEMDKRVEREKRSVDSNVLKENPSPNKFNIPSIYNHNWKGQMQLYPDELSFIMKQSAIQNPQNIKYDLPKDMEPAKESFENADTEYVENNLSNKYAKLAQAYSDYGVFSGKKDYLPHEKSTFVTENDMFRQKYTNDEIAHGKEENIKNKRRRNSKLPSPRHDLGKFERKSYNSEHFSGRHNISESNSTDNGNSRNSEFATLSSVKSQKETYDNNEEGNEIIFPSYYIKRSLKSIVVENLKNLDVKDGDVVVKKEETFGADLFKEIKQGEINKTSETRNETLEGFGDILHTLSEWFLTLAKLSGEFGNNSTLRENNGTQKLAPTILIRENITKDITYPMYDADMIDNIGHRSRTLLTIKENISKMPSSATNMTAKMKDLESMDEKQTNSSSKSSITNATVASIAIQPKVNASENINKTHADSDPKKNRTVIKRSADSNLIFWNDIYDDEYGIKVDYFNNEQRSKHSADNENFVKRSGQWINKKFRKLGDRFRTKSNLKKNPMKTTKHRVLRSVDDLRAGGNYLQNDQSQLYGLKTSEEGKDAENSLDFATLTANMKQVCREAAKAVQKTRSITARQEISGEFEATSLMQQLVRLMTDLIDFQVQQKTCAKLPSDLAEFLNWLTSPNAKYPDDNKFLEKKSKPTENANSFSNQELLDISMPSLYGPFLRESRDDPRTELVNTLRAVKDLLHKYQELNNDEKIKLIGVKEYLDKQMDFLTKQLSTYEYKIPSVAATLFRKRRLPLRRKRQMKTEPGDVEILRKPPALKRVNKFVKIYGVKRTKTTSSYIDSIATENLRKKKDEGSSIYPSETLETTTRTAVTKNVTINVKT